MPGKNIVKFYTEDGYYHMYNRGVEKRKIFLDEQDCSVFLHYVKLYLSPLEELRQLVPLQPRLLRFLSLNLSKEIDLLAFALMPNHIHLFVKQYKKDAITKLMRRLATAYVMYFNKKYKRVGALFQSRYKGALIDEDIYFLHLSRYIHLNPFYLKTTINFKEFSSYPYYLGEKKASWIKPEEIISYFNSAKKQNAKYTDLLSYQSFVEDYQEDPREHLQELTLEDDDENNNNEDVYQGPTLT